jgi:DNA polymerase phi
VKPSVDSKKKKKDAKQSVINFKYRVLDLLDIYVKNEALNPLGLDLLAPLLRLMRTTSAKPLAHQACEIILNYQKALKKARSNKEAVKGSSVSEDLLPVLAEIHDEASKDQSHAYAKAASAASLVVASLMFAVDRTSITQVVVVYAKTQSEWVLGNAKLQASFFTEWNNWCQNQASQAA